MLTNLAHQTQPMTKVKIYMPIKIRAEKKGEGTAMVSPSSLRTGFTKNEDGINDCSKHLSPLH